MMVMAPWSRVASDCGDWQTGTMSGYDNLDGADDANPGSLAEYTGTTEEFLDNVPVASILESDWDNDKYRNIEINYNGNIQTVQSWDQCANADCPDGGDCCTDNAQMFADPGYLLDVEQRTLSRLFGIDDYTDFLVEIQYRICDPFDPDPVAEEYGLEPI